jgi:dTDP-4-dehydrorhamnose 3,5-epimerase
VYLCSTPFVPGNQQSIDPFDEDIAIAWPEILQAGRKIEYKVGSNDRSAPGLAEAHAASLLPIWKGSDEISITSLFPASQPTA